MTSAKGTEHVRICALEHRQRMIYIYKKILENTVYLSADEEDVEFKSMKNYLESHLTEIIIIEIKRKKENNHLPTNCFSLTRSIFSEDENIRSRNVEIGRRIDALEYFGFIEKRDSISDKNKHKGKPINITPRFNHLLAAMEVEIDSLHQHYLPMDSEEYVNIDTKEAKLGDE